ncbi:MAG: plasmid replication protein, CyRepA1 family [Cyanobacteria bacterium P01_A01_bin.40]
MGQQEACNDAGSNFNSINPDHLTEWQQSGVARELTKLNVFSLSGLPVYDYLLYALPEKDRRNDGRLRDKIYKRYQHLEHGGWYIAGLDPDNNWIDVMVWGRFKPDRPRIQSDGKSIKYESPPQTTNRVTYFRIPPCIWNSIASRYGIKRYHSPLALRLTARKQPVNFWQWVKDTPEIPLILTEGEKKAGALLSQGYAAISLPGIWGGRNSKQIDPSQKLHDDLKPLAQAGRTFIILYDYDRKQSTREAVYKATLAMGKAIVDAGCKCKVALLPGPEKGVDDFIAAKGDSASSHLARIINNAHTISEYKWIGNPTDEGLIKYAPEKAINTRYLTDAKEVDLNRPGVIGIKSEMATGKTTLVRNYRRAHADKRFLVLGHRISLLRELSLPHKLDTTMYSEISPEKLIDEIALSITVDSLHKLATENNKYYCIFIDEARQVVRHILTASTCKQHRHKIISILQYLIRNAHQVIIADAHLDDLTIDFFMAMRSADESPLVIHNTYTHPSRPVFYYEGKDYTAMLTKMIAAVEENKKVMAVSDSKSIVEKLEQILVDRFVLKGDLYEGKQKLNKIIWSIHADNSGSEANQNFINNISQAVKDVDVLVASPSLCTGVDIQGKHFDEVYGFFNNVSLTATDCLQALHRYRNGVPLHVWVAPRPSFGYGDTNANLIRDKKIQLSDFNNLALGIDPETGKQTPLLNWAFELYCQVEADCNRSLNNLRDHLHRLLARMGYEITVLNTPTDAEAKEQIKEATKKVTQHQIERVTNAPKINREQYLNLKNKPYITPEEQYGMERFRIEDSYGVEVNEDLVRRDKKGGYLSQLIALEAILSPPSGERIDPQTKQNQPIPPKIVMEKDMWELNNLLFLPDRQHFCAQWYVWHYLGIAPIVSRLLAGEEYCETDPDVIKLAEKVGKCRQVIKDNLGFWIPINSSPTWILGMFIQKLGLKTRSRKVGSSGEQVTYYSLATEEVIFARSVLEYRQQQREIKEERKRQKQEENCLYRIMMATQFDVKYDESDLISTPPDNNNISIKEQGVDMAEMDTVSAFEKMNTVKLLLEEIGDLGRSVIKGLEGSKLKFNFVVTRLISYLLTPMKSIPNDPIST